MPDGDLVGADEDVLDDQSEHVLAFGEVAGRGAVLQAAEESFEVVGQSQVGVAVLAPAWGSFSRGARVFLQISARSNS
jgi:hypothetical protein